MAAGDAGGAVGLGEAVRVAGIGCRRGVSAEEVMAAVAAAGGAVDALAVVAGEGGGAGRGGGGGAGSGCRWRWRSGAGRP